MAWLIGLDEAGYGPNLGPLVQTAVAAHVPDGEANLWETLADLIRKADEAADHRLLIDDSKRVHDGAHGLRKLERGVLTALGAWATSSALPFGDFLQPLLIGSSLADLAGEDWFDRAELLPVVADPDELTAASLGWREGLASRNIRLGPVFSRIVPAPRFNARLEECQLKSVILAEGVIAFCEAARQLPGNDPIFFAVDRLGGRTFYAPMLQAAFPDGWVRTLREGSAECRYQILGLERDVVLSFQPRADGAHMTVALASMVSKYLREVCMRQFNRCWAGRIPGIRPTAGYPADAARFMNAIRQKLVELGIAESRVWRRK